MNDPRSSRWREVDAKRDLPTPSDLGRRMTEWKDLEEVSRGQQDNGTKYCCNVPFYKNK
jgi:hypothetical protein